MTNKEIMECIIIAILIVGNVAGIISLVKLVIETFIHIVREEAY